MPEARPETRPAGDRVPQLTPHRFPDAPVNQPVEQRVLDAQPHRGAAVVESPPVGDGGVGGPVEDAPLAAGVGLLLRRPEGLVEMGLGRFGGSAEARNTT